MSRAATFTGPREKADGSLTGVCVCGHQEVDHDPETTACQVEPCTCGVFTLEPPGAQTNVPGPAKASAPLPLPPPAEEPPQDVLNEGLPVTPRELTWADRIEALEEQVGAQNKHIAALHAMVDQLIDEHNAVGEQLNRREWHPDLTRELVP